jgi:hypothetical protein
MFLSEFMLICTRSRRLSSLYLKVGLKRATTINNCLMKLKQRVYMHGEIQFNIKQTNDGLICRASSRSRPSFIDKLNMLQYVTYLPVLQSSAHSSHFPLQKQVYIHSSQLKDRIHDDTKLYVLRLSQILYSVWLVYNYRQWYRVTKEGNDICPNIFMLV